MQFIAEAEIPTTHPSLPGHFPGYPIVPGVVLLDTVIETARRHLGGCRILSLPNAKFVAPLGPGVRFTIELASEAPGSLRFVVKTMERTIASGSLRYQSSGDRA